MNLLVRPGRSDPRRLCALLLLLAVAACATSPPVRFYKLESRIEGTSGMSVSSSNSPSFTVAIGPVTIPPAVDRPQMVLDAGPNRVTISEQSRWAEPLKESIPRVMANDLSQLLGNASISSYPQVTIVDPDYRVLVDVRRFDSAQGDAAIIDVHWAVREKNNGTQKNGRTFKREPTNGSEYDDLVAAHERALAAVSRDVAKALEEIMSRR